MAGSQGNDFFLKFDSDANTFGQKLAGELEPGVAKINELREALLRYEAQSGKMKGGSSPLGSIFTGLDEAAARIETAMAGFTREFGVMVGKIAGLAEALATVQRDVGNGNGRQPPLRRPIGSGEDLRPGDPGTRGSYGGIGGLSPAEKARLDEMRGAKPTPPPPAVSRVTQADQTAAASGRTGKEDLSGLNASLVSGLETLNARLKALAVDAEHGGGASKPPTEPTAAEVQIGNTVANPVPIIAVGGEPSAVGGHPKGPPHTTTATTATSTEDAKEKLASPSVNPHADLVRQGLITEREAELLQEQDRVRAATQTRTGTPGGYPRARPEAPYATSGSNSEPPEQSTRARTESAPKIPVAERPIPVTGRALSEDVATRFNALTQETQRALQSAREILQSAAATRRQQDQAIARAASAFRADPAVSGPDRLFNSARDRGMSFGQFVGLDTSKSGVRGLLTRDVFSQGGTADQYDEAERVRNASSRGPGTDEATHGGDGERIARVNKIIAESSGTVRNARLAEFIAEQNLQRVRTNSAASAEQVARAEIQLAVASRNTAAAMQQESREQNANIYQRATGRTNSFGKDLLRHGTNALENTIGYSIVFTGFEKLREVIHTGLEADAAFVRLRASLDANGVAVGNLRTHLAQISATTATPIQHVTEAAAELAGVFKDTGDLAFATNIASQLANISQGTLTAKEAAVGLRDVTAAYGLHGQKDIQSVGDQIAHLSQLTGVSVKDITEGTTQIAQEARDFNLTRRQAATLAAYVTQGTGETGEQAASQLSRMLSTLYNGSTQRQLVKLGVATESQFSEGKIGDVLTNLIEKYDGMNESAKQSIASLMGTGIQARAFAALMNGGAAAVAELNSNLDDTGSLGKQNQAFLNTVAGAIKQLDQDFLHLGSTLARMGAFDAIGILAQALDQLFKSFNRTFGTIASLMDSNPITGGMMHWTAMILEAAAAWRIFGGLATTALVKLGVLKGMSVAGGLVPRNLKAINDATAAGQTPPGARYDRVRFGSAAAASGRSLGALPLRLVDRISLPPDQTFRGAMAGAVGLGAQGGLFSGLRSRFSVGNPWGPTTLSGVGTPHFQGWGPTTLSGAGVAPPLWGATTLAGRGLATGAPTSGGFGPTTTYPGSAAAEKNLARLGDQAYNTSGAIQRLGLASKLAAEEQAAAGAGAAATGGRLRAFSSGLLTNLAAFAAQLGLVALVVTAFSQLQAAGNDAKERKAAGGRINDGSTDPADMAATQPHGGVRGFRDMYTGNSSNIFAEIGHGASSTFKGAVDGYMRLATLNQYHGPFNGPQSGASDESNDQELMLASRMFGHAKTHLPKMKTAKEVQNWLRDTTAEIDKEAGDIKRAGGNDANSQAQIQYSINQVKGVLKSQAEHRIEALMGLASIDQLTTNQAQHIVSALGQLGSFSADTLKSQAEAVRQITDMSLAPPGSKAYDAIQGAAGLRTRAGVEGKNAQGQIGVYDESGVFHDQHISSMLRRSEGGNMPQVGFTAPATSRARLKDLLAGYDATIKSSVAKLDLLAGAEDTPEYTVAKQNRDTALTAYQQTKLQLRQNPIQVSQARAALNIATGGTMIGNDQQAVEQLRTANLQLATFNKAMDPLEPQYWANLQQIQQNKQQIAALLGSPELHGLQLQASTMTDATALAANAYSQAVAKLHMDQAAGATSDQITSDQAAINQSNIGIGRTAQAVTEARGQANIASIRNEVGKGQAQLNAALQKQAAYGAGGPLADQAQYLAAVSEEIQARQSIADSIQAQTQSVYDVTSAYQKVHGNTVGAAQTALAKANNQYQYAVQTFGADSQQANEALAQTVQAGQELRIAALDKLNSALDLQIAKLNARGLAGDSVRAANAAKKKIQNAIQSYLRAGGNKGTAEYNALMSQLATAQRTSFDAALNAQLETLDFQQQTYKITSAQEVRALQQILKNKQLTLKEQRDITLKIKSLQDSIRQQLTQGGLNIPSDIKLPTAYEVRRSIGAGFGGSTTHASVVNNNSQVTINNNVPNTAVAAHIANQVISLINKQTGQHIRANTSTPRLVSR